MTAQPSLVILRALGLGDFLTAVPAYRALAREFPRYRRILAAPSALRPLIDLVGGIDELSECAPLGALEATLDGVDIAVNLHGRGPQSHRRLLALQPARLVAFAHADVPQSALGAVWRFDEHEVARWCRLLTQAGIAADPGDLDLAVPVDVAVPAHVRGATLIHASAASESRRWPLARWAAVARAEIASGRRVVLTGSADDIGLANTIADLAGMSRAGVYAGRTSVRELAAFVAAAGCVACGDTGVAHLATAYRTPSVVLFWPGVAGLVGSAAERSIHRVLWAGKVGDPHAGYVDPGLLAVPVDAVITALGELHESR